MIFKIDWFNKRKLAAAEKQIDDLRKRLCEEENHSSRLNSEKVSLKSDNEVLKREAMLLTKQAVPSVEFRRDPNHYDLYQIVVQFRFGFYQDAPHILRWVIEEAGAQAASKCHYFRHIEPLR